MDLKKRNRYFVLVEVSNKHVHLSQEHLDILFGKDYQLTPKYKLSQVGEFAAEETIDVEYKDQKLEHVRIVGPVRGQTQVELLAEDCVRLYNQSAPIRLSGNLTDTLGATLVGLEGKITIPTGVIIALNHLHLSTHDGEYFKLKASDIVTVDINGHLFRDIVVRVGDRCRTVVHIDRTQANKIGLEDVSTSGTLYI